MPMPQLLSNFLDCFACCGQGSKDARHDQYLQPLTLLQPQVHAASGAAAGLGGAGLGTVFALLGWCKDPLAVQWQRGCMLHHAS